MNTSISKYGKISRNNGTTAGCTEQAGTPTAAGIYATEQSTAKAETPTTTGISAAAGWTAKAGTRTAAGTWTTVGCRNTSTGKNQCCGSMTFWWGSGSGDPAPD